MTPELPTMSVPEHIVFAAACSGDQAARLYLDMLYPIGPCEYCSWDMKGQRGHFLGCPRFSDGEIAGSPIQQAKYAFVNGEIDAAELERRVERVLQKSAIATGRSA